MAVKCSKCDETTYEVVDAETDVKGRAFVLVKCKKCEQTIILPKDEWEADG